MIDVDLGPYRIGVATDYGPRVVSLRRDDGPEVLASLGLDSRIDYPGGIYHFRGGHRLWAAPEVAAVTYASDGHECSVEVGDYRVTVSSPADDAGITKEISVVVNGETLEVQHSISGDGRFAAWAITQLPLGGVAFLAMNDAETAPLPNRNLVLWPYTSVEDDRLTLRDRAVMVDASDGPALKVGVGPRPGRLGYLREGQLFVKETLAATEGAVPDLGAAAQVYVGQGFCELETVGGLGESSATITERWEVVSCRSRDEAERRVVDRE